ncbi:MAG: Fe-S cluster assembly protein SufD [Candidatus Eisenbacteria bacterium]|nr:Fe-S cluster assembly protein SufD [Candidatus Eisenbacteria bacterium]
MTSSSLETRSQGAVAEWPALAAARARQAGEPGWALEQRRRAAENAARLPFPDRSLELWRRTDFGSLSLGEMQPFAPGTRARNVDDLPAAVLERLAGEAGHLGLVVQRNSEVVLEQTHPALERQGVILCSMERALREHADKLEGRLGALIETGHDRFTALHHAARAGGAFVWVPDGVEAELPIQLLQWLDGPGLATTPGTVIVLGRGARATVVEELLSASAEGASFHDGGTEVFVGEDAKLVYAHLQDWGRNVYHYSNQRAQVARGAELQWIQTVLGSRMTKTNSYFDLAGPGAQVYVHGFMFGDRRQHFDLHTLQRHRVDHTTSDLLIKCALKDRARSVYQGLIQVAEGAQRTDAYQANRNLLLSETARADSIPGLEILANDVRCTHGATIGSVDPEQMYYLMSRGLPPNEAQRLIVEGFFVPVLDRIPLESVRDQLRGIIQHKIG